jgi:hypothetical protein
VTYRVADVDGEEPAPLVFTIRVDGIPRFDETVSSQITFAEGQTIDPWVLPSASGGNGQLTYELVGELPEGLAYDGATRTISGTLSADATYAAESDGYVVRYQVTDQDGDAPEALVFTIVIHGMPSFGAQVVEDQSYEAGGEETLGLPEAVGGNGALTYTLEGELPAGLSFDGAGDPARTISGTPPTDATGRFRVRRRSLRGIPLTGIRVCRGLCVDVSGGGCRWRRAGPVGVHDSGGWYTSLRRNRVESNHLCRRPNDRSLGVAFGFGWQRPVDV